MAASYLGIMHVYAGERVLLQGGRDTRLRCGNCISTYASAPAGFKGSSLVIAARCPRGGGDEWQLHALRLPWLDGSVSQVGTYMRQRRCLGSKRHAWYEK